MLTLQCKRELFPHGNTFMVFFSSLRLEYFTEQKKSAVSVSEAKGEL